MQYQKKLLAEISDHKHKTGYGTDISKELLQIFRIKNLFLFSFKLIQRYELLTLHACAQINKNILMRRLEEQEKEIEQLENQLISIKNSLASFMEKIESLRQSLESLDDHFLPSGLSKVNAICQSGTILAPNIFVNCQDIFYKKLIDSNLNHESVNLISQRPPIEFYEDLMHLQLHFHLLLIQGCNFALPLLTTKLSFISRIIYWPSKPLYGFENKSKRLRDKLIKIKLLLSSRLEELINAIGEVEKWILFYQNSHQVYGTLMKAACDKKKEILFEMNNLRSTHNNLILEHNRLVGAILKIDAKFFKGSEDNPNSASIEHLSLGLTFSSSTDSLSAFSLNSAKNLDIKDKRTNEIEVSLTENPNMIFNANALMSVPQTPSFNEAFKKPPISKNPKEKIGLIEKLFSKDSADLPVFKERELPISLIDMVSIKHRHSLPSNSDKSLEFIKSNSVSKTITPSRGEIVRKSLFNKCQSISTISSLTPIRIPSTGRSPGRLMNISSAPGEPLHCHCVDQMPSTEEIRKSLLGNPKFQKNQNSHFIQKILKSYSKESNENCFLNTEKIFSHVKKQPKFHQINNDIQENLGLLNELTGEVNNSNYKLDQSLITNSSVIWNTVYRSPHVGRLINSSEKENNNNKFYFNILNEYLTSCGIKSEKGFETDLFNRKEKNNFSHIFTSLNMEHDILIKHYTMDSLFSTDHPGLITSDVEVHLVKSLKLYSKYLN